ncbi:MAG: FtsW/RodA/SpoVE family cell cycle protein [Finegoldia sp.]|nr:FtsW/RodA/SpoVE family cell cycle protein [Finegoldia sp.]
METSKKSRLSTLFNPFNKNINKKKTDPTTLLLIFDIIAFALALGSNPADLTSKSVLYFIIVTAIIFLANKLIIKLADGDAYMIQIASMLFSIGIIMIYRLDPATGIKQISWFILGLMVFFLTLLVFTHFKFWQKLSGLYLVLCFFLFFITLILGSRTNGAINWISIGPFNFQPSEITKILFILFLASYDNQKHPLDKINIEKNDRLRSWLPIIKKYFLMLVVYFFIGLFFIQRDLGTAVVFYGVFLVYQIVTDEDIKLIIFNILLALLGAVAAYFLFSHIRIRVATWLNPWADVNGTGYQITQALFAIASGGFFGTGLGLGNPDMIPVVTSDFIFAAICEEMGIFTGMAVIMLFLMLIYRGMKIAMEQSQMFYKILAIGISTIFAIQGIIMFGGVLKLIPLTGITIPFVSYGGSSMISSFISLAILQYASLDHNRGDDYE